MPDRMYRLVELSGFPVSVICQDYTQQIIELITKSLREELTQEELSKLRQLLDNNSDENLYRKLLNNNIIKEEAEKLAKAKIGISNKVYAGKKNKPQKPGRSIAAIAASFLVIAGCISFYLWNRDHLVQEGSRNSLTTVSITPENVQPANNQTILTLADGRTIILDSSVADGTVAKEKEGSVVKMENGELIYQSPGDHSNLSIIYNTVTTSKGGKQRIVLSDGTIVWLNATSSIKFPIAFTENERKVFISGEAYFEVSQYTPFKGGGKVPFIVSLPDGNEVEVLGTHFNINSYSDEENVKVTLLEGKVKVSKANGESAMLKPGQQAVFTHHSPLTIHHLPDIDQVMAWKNGLFNFKNAGIEVILREASRWYDIDVIYDGKSSDKFGGKISRQVNLGQLLMILKESDVSFEFKEGRKLIIYDTKSKPEK